MKINIVFDSWRKAEGEPLSIEETLELSLDNFHYGTIFNGEIDLDVASEKKLIKAIEAGYVPTFYVIKEK